MSNRSIYLPGPAKVDSTRHNVVPDAAVRGKLLFTGGVAGFDENGALPETHEAQAGLIFDRLDAILSEAGFSRGNVGHWFNWAPDRHSKIAPINPHWERWFPKPADRPARHALARALDPGMQYRIEIIAVKDAPRRAYEINDRVYHTGGTTTPGFMPFGTTMGDFIFTGPTYGMYAANRRMGETALRQAELIGELNNELYRMTGHSEDNLGQIFVWYHDDVSRAASIRQIEAMFPDPNDRPALHYIHSKLPYWPEVEGQFLVQHDIVGKKGAKRRVLKVPGVIPMDGAADGVPPGVVLDNLLFTSVCLGQDGNGLAGSLEQQVRLAFDNVQKVVEAGEFALNDIGHFHVWYADHGVREMVDKVWLERFPRMEDRPARHCVISDLPAGALVGLEAIAAR